MPRRASPASRPRAHRAPPAPSARPAARCRWSTPTFGDQCTARGERRPAHRRRRQLDVGGGDRVRLCAEANSAWPAARSTAAAAISIARITASDSVMPASSRSTAARSRRAPRRSWPAGRRAVAASSRRAICSTARRAASTRAWLVRDGGARLVGGRRLRPPAASAAATSSSAACAAPLSSSAIVAVALVEFGPQPAPLAERRDGRRARGARGVGDDLGLLEPLGQRGRPHRPRPAPPSSRLAASARSSGEHGRARR